MAVHERDQLQNAQAEKEREIERLTLKSLVISTTV
jgi:hypothetical protein